MTKKGRELILAFVGMPGSGKTEATKYLRQKNIPFVRFGEITDEGLRAQKLPLTPKNERIFREKIRQELGMAAYAIKSKPKIEALLRKHNLIVVDGLYSWEEYIFLKKIFPELILIHVFAEPKKRYKRLSQRSVRPIPLKECYERDLAEIENLNKGGPIAIADYLIDNNDNNIEGLHRKIDKVLERLEVNAKNDTY